MERWRVVAALSRLLDGRPRLPDIDVKRVVFEAAARTVAHAAGVMGGSGSPISTGVRKVAIVAMAMPVLPGKEQTWLDYVNRLQSTELRDEYQASRRALGMTRETVWSQRTPDGRLAAVVLMEADDVDAVLGNMATSDDPFTVQFRDLLKDVHGVDVGTDPLPEVTMLSDTRFEAVSESSA
jgi:hypothetical protein